MDHEKENRCRSRALEAGDNEVIEPGLRVPPHAAMGTSALMFLLLTELNAVIPHFHTALRPLSLCLRDSAVSGSVLLDLGSVKTVLSRNVMDLNRLSCS